MPTETDETDETKHYAAAALPAAGRPLPVLVLPGHRVFPGVGQQLRVTSPAACALVDALPAAASPFVLVAAAEPALQPGAEGAVVVLAQVRRTMGHVSGNHGIALDGIERVRLTSVRSAGAFPIAATERIEAPPPRAVDAAFDRLRALTRSVVACMPELPRQAVGMVDAVADPGRFCDLCAAHLDLSPAERATVLAAVDVEVRVAALGEILAQKERVLRPRHAAWQRDEMREPWPFLPGAEQRLRRDVASGRMTAAEAEDIRHLAEKGFVVWQRLIAPELVDALLASVRSIARHPGHFVTTNHRHGRPYAYSDADFDAYESVFDLYVNFESARAVCLHPKIVRFLELVFDAPPIAFQQLLFQRSNGHPLHQDTAYVWVDQPMQMLATWVALEDVVQGRGELTYFEGSHRIPHFRFGDGSKRFDGDHDRPEPVARHIVEQVAARGCTKHDFLAKQGDVFVWAADLVHGSNPRTRPLVETRRSCVTHYCPTTTQPFWFRRLEHHRGLQPYGAARIASSYYRLPKEADLVRPAFLLPELPASPAE
ncbi:MAG: LON peptidase substrate-binding domain-containing protein [Planctomycetes bacterium]|nr:LON peptidase substrate-binding domain-containing protein [Planctomycetota bacterium]